MVILNISIVVATFFFMEFMAWSMHKYVMHGLGWYGSSLGCMLPDIDSLTLLVLQSCKSL